MSAIDVKTLALAKKAARDFASNGIKKIENINNELIFTMLDDTTKSVGITASGNIFTNEEKNKLLSLNAVFLNRFSFEHNELLFDGNPISDVIDLSDYYTKTEIATLFAISDSKVNTLISESNEKLNNAIELNTVQMTELISNSISDLRKETIFDSYANLQAYALSSDSLAGQICAVVDIYNSLVSIYKINTDKTISSLNGNSGGGASVVSEWKTGSDYVQHQLISYLGKLYKATKIINNAILSPDIDPGNYEVYSGSGGSGGNSIKFADFVANKDYSYGECIVHDNCLLSAKSSFTSGDTFKIKDWNVISDMLKIVYDANGNSLVDRAEHSLVADLALETALIQSWKPYTKYTLGQNLVYNNETYTVTTNFTSGEIFDKTYLVLSATGNHNGLINLQGGNLKTLEYYHINKSQNDVIAKMTDSNGSLYYNGNIVGDMKRSIYDSNLDGIVDKAATLNGLSSSITELNYMHGVTKNVQQQINSLSSVGNFTGTVPTYADISTQFPNPSPKDMVIVLADENNSGTTCIYLYSASSWIYAGRFTATMRDFSLEPLDVILESVGMFSENRIDPAIARKVDIISFPNSDLLLTYTQTDSDLTDAVTKRHVHYNQSLLDTYTQTNTDIGTAINKSHLHSNQTILDNFSEDGDGNPLYNGKFIANGGSGGSGGISNLDNFNTGDLKDTNNFRYVTDAEKASIQNLSAISATQSSITSNIANINSSIPSDVSSTNKLVTTNAMNNKLSGLKLVNLADVDKVVKPNAFLITNSTGTQVTYLSSIKSMIKIQKVTDKDGIDFTDVPNLRFRNLSGVQRSDGTVELTMENLFSTNLLDMPKKYENGKVLVSNESAMGYVLKDISLLTNSKENFTKLIAQTDWLYDDSLKLYTCQIGHTLKSKNLIVASYDAYDSSLNNISWKLAGDSSIILKSPTNESIRVIINCSQGTVGDGTGVATGTTSVTAGDFIDDTRIRTDKTFSSTKINNLLTNYVTKNAIYTKEESTSLFSNKINEHIHTNINSLNKITEDSLGNMYFGGQKILTNLQPYTYQKNWNKQIYTSSTLLVNTNSILTTNNYSVIMESEVIVQNDIASSNDTENVKLENQLHLIAIDNSIVVLDVLIPPGSTQKYKLGISPNVKIMISGKFTANYYLTAY